MRQALEDLIEVVEAAINAGDWKVDGACEPTLALVRAKRALEQPEQLYEENERLHVENRRLIDRIETIGVPVGVGGFATTTAQPEQEPVKMIEYICLCGKGMKFESKDGIVAPQCKPLTDEQIQMVHDNVPDDYTEDSWVHSFARAIEAAHGIKE